MSCNTSVTVPCHFLQCPLEKVGRRGGANHMAMFGLRFKSILVGTGGPFPLSYAQMAEKTVLSPCRIPISGSEVCPSPDEWLLAESCDYCKFVNGWGMV